MSVCGCPSCRTSVERNWVICPVCRRQLSLTIRQRGARLSRFLLPGLLISFLIFVAVAPTLTLLEFSNGAENLVVATALEIRRDGCWTIPTLQGELRTAKPPLAAWIAALAIDGATLKNLAVPDINSRTIAEAQLAWSTRWPFLLSACAMVLAVYVLGRIVAGSTTGWLAALICGTTFLFLRFGRAATTDVQLALWVTVASALLAAAATGRRPGIALPFAGVALGLAFMSKGPVAILQTVLPIGIWWIWDRARERLNESNPKSNLIGPLILAVVLFAIVAIPWYLLVAARSPGVWSQWQVEIIREGATRQSPGKWYAYLVLFPFLMPWTVLFAAGMFITVMDLFARPDDHRIRRWMLPLLLVLVPLLIMSFFRDRKDRYLLPMLGPAAIVAARAVADHYRGVWTDSRAGRALVSLHWVFLAGVAIGLPVVGALLLRTIDGSTWYSPRVAAGMSYCFALLLLVGYCLRNRIRASLVASTVLTMLALNVVFLYGYRDSREGRSELKPLASALWQSDAGAPLYTTHHRKQRVPSDLSIYMNRAVRWIDYASIQSVERPCIVVVRQDENEPPPVPPLRGTEVARVPRDQSWWYAFSVTDDEPRVGSALP